VNLNVGSIPAGDGFTRRSASFHGFKNGKVRTEMRTNPLISSVVRPCLPMLVKASRALS
jgi:hypothetical protein